MKKNHKKDLLLSVFLLTVLIIGVGYAYLTSNLLISGGTIIAENNWDIHFENIQINPSSISAEMPATIDSNDNTKIRFEILLSRPGDYYEFTVDVVNAGSIDGMIEEISSKINGSEITEIPTYLEYRISYNDGVEINQKHILKTNDTETYKIHIEYKKDINTTDLPENSETTNFEFEVTYTQADETSIPVPHPLPINTVELGDYVYLQPDATTYTVLKEDTGYTSDQTIKPNELTIWRIIKKNENGSIDAISEYTSSNIIYFKETQGFANFVGCLQTITSNYNKQGYTDSVREIGFDGQTPTITTRLYLFNPQVSFNNPGFSSTPSPTEGTGREYSSGVAGDTLYLKDYQLVSNVYKNDSNTYGSSGLKAKKVGTNTEGSYWLSSRVYYVETNFGSFGGRYINTSGEMISNSFLIKKSMAGGSRTVYTRGYYIRPIITINNKVKISSGNGSIENPYLLVL